MIIHVFEYTHLLFDVGIGITNQRETTVVWDKVTGEPLHNAIGSILHLFIYFHKKKF
jgi:hypothetical protein